MAQTGRNIRISRAGVAIAGARTDTVTINNEPIDITDKDDAGWRTLLDDAGVRTITMDVEGIIKTAALAASSVGGSGLRFVSCDVDITDIGTVTGTCSLANLQLGAELADAVTFTATLELGVAPTVTIAPYPSVMPSITVNGGADSGNLTGDSGTWLGDATITLVTTWQYNLTTGVEDAPGWASTADEATAETRHAAGAFVRIRVAASNSVGDTIAYSPAVT